MFQITIQEVATLVGGHLLSPDRADALIARCAAVESATPGDLTFLGNPKYLRHLRKTGATAALVPVGFSESVPCACVAVENPSLAFGTVLERMAPRLPEYPPGINPSAVVSPNATVSESAHVGPGAVIEAGASVGDRVVIGALGYVGPNASVGDGTFLHPRVTVLERCVVGRHCILHSGVVLGSDGYGFEFSGGRHTKIPQIGIVQVDDYVEIGANTTIDRARFGRTWIGEGTKIDNLVQIAHNVVVGKHCLLVAQVGISGSTRLGNFVTLAGQVGVVGHLEIGDQAVAAGQSGITRDVPAKAAVMGTPAIPMSDYKRQHVLLKGLEGIRRRLSALEQALSRLGSSPSEKASGTSD